MDPHAPTLVRKNQPLGGLLRNHLQRVFFLMGVIPDSRIPRTIISCGPVIRILAARPLESSIVLHAIHPFFLQRRIRSGENSEGQTLPSLLNVPELLTATMSKLQPTSNLLIASRV